MDYRRNCTFGNVRTALFCAQRMNHLFFFCSLAIKNGNVHSKLREKQAEERIRGLLKPFPNYENFVEDTIKILNDIDGFVERYVTVND